MAPREPSKPPWSAIKRALAQLDQAALLSLLKELYDRAPENRTFLGDRLLGQPGSEALEAYRKRISAAVYPRRLSDTPRIAEARRLLRSYQTATGDRAGTVELMIECLELGTVYLGDFGAMSEGFYTGLEAVLTDLVRLLGSEAGSALYPQVQARLAQLAQRAQRLGWGYSDFVAEQVESLHWSLTDEDETA